MKPFVSITIGNDSSAIPSLDKERLLHLARFKMSFDAVNRNLITARQSHFAYARIGTKRDNNYLRLVHQGTGTHQQLFARNTERIFNIQCCGTYIKPERDMQILLCTGIDGTVFWARLVENSEAETITIPPYPAAEDASPNSMVKTRAKCSSCHPEFFALSRTRMIYIVSPNIFKGYVDEKSRKVHTVKYIDDHCLRINTGKACKDYIFAGDDSMILTVDKANAIKFWDIGELTRLAGDVMEDKHWKEITEPVMTLTAKSPGGKGAEKMSAFSVTLLDKERPHNKKAALRYMLVGFKQNYVLQLWDLALGKVVQELRLPHTDGSGFCSINYHPRTSIITLGHPARNSVFFFHVSAPKYNLPPMSQAQYVNMLASGDPNLPRMESTAIISGVREMSLANCGQLYSLDLLPTPVDDSSAKEQGTHSLFELYIYHSRGCDAFPIKPADLGWDSLLRLTGTVDSSKTDFIRMEPLEESGDEASPPKGVRKPTGNAKTGAEDTEQSTKPLTEEQPGEDQKESKDEAQEEPPTVAKSTKDAEVYEPSVPLTNDSMPNLINDNFQSLYKRLDADKRVSEAAGAAKQDAILRLISSTLTDNVHQSLSSIVNASIEASVVPSLVKVIDDTLGAKLGPSIRREISNTLPNTLKQALMDSKVHNAIANVTACSIQKEIAQQIHTINKTTQSVLDGFESRNTKRFQAAEAQRREDQAKIQQLTDMVEAMSLKVQELASAKQAEREEPKMAEESQLKTLSEEVEEIKNELVSGNFEAGTIMWIKSARKIELFDELFSMVNPQYLTEVSTLAQVSVTAALTSSFDTLVHERLDYLSTVLSMMDTRDKDVAPILSTVMGVLAQRLHSLQLVCSCASPKDEDLVKKIQLLHDHAKFLEQMATSE
ncbi:hypothetical protein K470DRAFT_259787 [Piedraia hortae CBS 480.64]|uniref:EDC4-like protein pdc1 beta-propeller domain-containing protein n=1 Tax=Piedraia hortae CBS 480.64 TaxID=1314780 RepID=A0A6A7BTT3_9PEZI|nr:hypothetical protein K470DRAFT_259787 [Piedraia hortae CBS 480.64]